MARARESGARCGSRDLEHGDFGTNAGQRPQRVRAKIARATAPAGLAYRGLRGRLAAVKSSFVTWQLRQLHAELDALDRRPAQATCLGYKLAVQGGEPGGKRARAARAILLDRFLRSLPTRLGFPNPRAFAHAFARANHLLTGRNYARRRLSEAELQGRLAAEYQQDAAGI